MFRIPLPDIMITEKCNMACKYCFESDKCGKSLNHDELIKFIDENDFDDFFPFGGEPLVEPELAEELVKRMKDPKLITNGTLIKDNVEMLKKYNVRVQISLDGPKHVNDRNRVNHAGKGTFDKVMEAIEICEKEGIRWGLHGVISKDTIKYTYDIWMFYIETTLKYKGLEALYGIVGGNLFQIIFEEDYNDEDMYHLITGFVAVLEDMKRVKDIDYPRFIESITTRKGGVCGAGAGLYALDTNMDVYACHRLTSVDNREKYKLCNVYHPEEIDNYKDIKHYARIRKIGMYSSNKSNKPNDIGNWHMWCPGTNIQTSDNIYYQSCKFNHMIEQLEKILSEYRDNFTRKPDNSDGHQCNNK